MKFRIFLRSFDKHLILKISCSLRINLLKTNCKILGNVFLPMRIKKFCVLRSPHVNKDSREHFELRLYKCFFDVSIDSISVLNILLKMDMFPGIFCSLKIL